MIAIESALAELSAEERTRLLDRGRSGDPDVAAAVADILDAVRARGDAALRELARRFDGVELEAIEVPRARWTDALEGLDPAVRHALETAAGAIETFHRWQLPAGGEVEPVPGVRLGRRPEPLRRVGVYAPGGRAAYPSSVLMGVVPARVAGVDQVIVCSPPGPDGLPAPAVLAACAIAGADRVFALGGAGAIAALAYGTGSVPAVDKVVGPGNAYVNEAKRRLTGRIAIDNPAGPSELLVVADDTADPELIALELAAQAEHDPDAAVALVTASPAVAAATRAALEALLPEQPRREIIEASLAASGAILTATDLDEALAFAERYAPEHLLLLVAEPRAALERVRAAGTVFLGPASSVAFGDYATGANHVLPTGGLARAYGGLATADFLRWTTYQELDDEGARRLAGPTATLADAEGLPGHARAARRRAQDRAAADGAASDGAGGAADNAAADSVNAAPDDARGAGTGTGESEVAGADPGGRAAGAPLPRRAAYRDIALYDPRPGGMRLELSDNTNLFGTAPSAARVLAEGAALARGYPTPYATALKEAVARRFGVEPGNVVTGCGSDDVIDSAVRAFCEPGAVVAYPDPTFGMAEIFARMNAARPVAVPTADFALDADALLGAQATVTYVCRPNNPSGTLVDAGAVRRVLEGARGVVLIDEAYAEYAGESLLDDALGSGRGVVLRTLSKAYGLAGLRLGFGIGPAAVVTEIEKSRGPYKVGALAEAAAVAALDRDGDWVADVVQRTTENRQRLRAALEGRGLHVWPSAANFLLFRRPEWAEPVGSAPALDAAAALREIGVGVRAYHDLPGAGDCLRVGVGPWEMMAWFIEAWDGL